MTYTNPDEIRKKPKQQWLLANLFMGGILLYNEIYTFFDLISVNSMPISEAFLQAVVGPMLSWLGVFVIAYYCAYLNAGTKWLKIHLVIMPIRFLSLFIQTMKEVIKTLEQSPFLDWLQVGGVFVALWTLTTIFFWVKSFQLHQANIRYKRAVIAAEDQSAQEPTLPTFPVEAETA